MLRTYARLQRAAEGAAAELVGAGVPDRRLAVLPGQVAELVEELRPAGRGRARAARLTEACAELAALGIPETIEHSDLHDAQVFAAPDGDRFFDWGDASVAHPFLSLTVSLRVLASTVGVADDSPTVDTAIDAYLERWSSLAPLGDAAARRGARPGAGRRLAGADMARDRRRRAGDPAACSRTPRRSGSGTRRRRSRSILFVPELPELEAFVIAQRDGAHRRARSPRSRSRTSPR